MADPFNEAYGKLNAAQKEAVDSIEGPVMVIAGPGTGKTQILTLRIANILLKTDTRPENILALTFTESGAKAMRERLHMYIGALAYQVAIFTFHGFAERLIREHPDAYMRIVGGRPASDLEKVSLIETVLDDAQFKLLRPLGDTTYYVPHILRSISHLKKEYLSPDAFASYIAQQEAELLGIEKTHEKGAHKGKVRGEYSKKEKSIEKNRELLLAYRQYEALLREKRLYDFEDMIVETVEALQSNEDMLRSLQETYQYVLADEHQDVNGSQNRILELLCTYHAAPNIFVVGDEKQAIYRFQGASLENFLYFEDVFSKTTTIALTENYRSGQTILDAAHSLIKVEDGPLVALRVPLIASKVADSAVEQRLFSHQAIEDAWVVAEISSLIQEGIAHKEIAIIVRTNREVEHFASLLRREGIRAHASADGDVLDHPITHSVQCFIEAVVQSHNEGALFSLLHGAYWGIGASDLVRIAGARSYGVSLLSIISSTETLEQLGVTHIQQVKNVVQTLQDARAQDGVDAPHRVLQHMLQRSGFLDHILANNAEEGGRVVRRLYDEIEQMVLRDKKATLSEIHAVLALHKEHRIPLNAPYISIDSDAVAVTTAHKSKGLEFGAVFIPHVSDSVWGGAVKRTYFDIPQTAHIKTDAFDALDDERRLLYVAMTRAKEKLYFSCADENTEGKELIVSRLFEDIDPQHLQTKNSTAFESSFNVIRELQKSVPPNSIDAHLFAEHLRSKGLSATALNNYLKNPWEYVYRNVLRVPEVQAIPLLFGTAMHGVIEWAVRTKEKAGELPNPSLIKEELERTLARLPISQTEFVRLHEKGYAALLAYLAHVSPELPQESKVEFTIRVAFKTGLPEFPELPLTGKLDRLDFRDGKVYQVVDYKTGKPKTRNEIEGNTKSSNGDYKRQLTFYALLLSLYGDERYACRKGVLSFVEPDTKGNIHEEVFEISDEEIEDLKKELIRVAQEIVSGSFLGIKCDENTSNYCHLANMLVELA